MTRTEWERDWADARRGLHLHPPAADLLFRRGLRDPLLIARGLRPYAARFSRDSAYMRRITREVARDMIREGVTE